jgi:putative MFS transporter
MDHQVNAAARLDRLPLGPFHRRVLRLIGVGIFFDGFDMSMMASVLAALVAGGWSNMGLNASFISATFVGLTIGAALAGLLGDRLGRRFAYQFNLLIFGAMCLIGSVVPSMHWLIVIRGLMGVGLGAEFVVGYSMISEFIPPRHRGRYAALLYLVASVAVFAVSLVGLLVIPWLGWRAMFAIGGVGALWAWWLRRKLPESPRWLEAVGRTAEAERVMQEIEREAAQGRDLPSFHPAPVAAAAPRVPLSILFSRPVIRRTLLATAVAVACVVGGWSFTSWIPSFFIKQGLSLTSSLGFNTAMAAGNLAGPLIAVFLADRIGRRRGTVLSAFGCAAVGAVYPFLTDMMQIAACGFLLITFQSMFFAIGFAGYMPELFPTAYRFRGAGLAQTIGRAALIGSPYAVVALFASYGIGGVVGTISLLYLAVVVVVAFAGVETNQKSLEELAPEATVTGAAVLVAGSETMS